MSLKGEYSSWAPYIGLREQQALADVCEAMIKQRCPFHPADGR